MRPLEALLAALVDDMADVLLARRALDEFARGNLGNLGPRGRGRLDCERANLVAVILAANCLGATQERYAGALQLVGRGRLGRRKEWVQPGARVTSIALDEASQRAACESGRGRDLGERWRGQPAAPRRRPGTRQARRRTCRGPPAASGLAVDELAGGRVRVELAARPAARTRPRPGWARPRPPGRGPH